MPNITTTAPTTDGAMKTKISQLLALKKITREDIEHLDKREYGRLGETVTKVLSKLEGKERDDFIDKIELIMAADTKNSIWEGNHALITNAVSNYMRQHGIMPTKNAMAQQTGLSRQTIAKHFKEYRAHPEFNAETEQFKFMSQKVLANVFKVALNGDIRAARLYFDMVGALDKPQSGGIVNNQNNYIQVNNTILSQENLKQLTAEQLNQIESIVNNKEHKIRS
jgi:hypothetical protein